MTKNTVKTLFLSFTAVVALLILAACSSPKKAYFQLINQQVKQDVHVTLDYQDDKVNENETVTTIYYENAGLTKDSAKEQLSGTEDSMKDIKGVTYKLNFEDDHLTETLTVDFTKADLDELQSKQILQTSGNQDADYISYKETAKILKNEGYKEIKDGKFEEIK